MPPENNPLTLLLRKLRQHARLDEADQQAVSALTHTVRKVEPGTYLVREGQAPTNCAVLISGFAYRHKLTGNGDRQIVSLQIPGDPTDLQSLYLDVADHSVQMLTRGEIANIPRSELQALSHARPHVARAMMVAILVDASIFREWVLNVGRRDARARIAHVLCEFAVRLDGQKLARGRAYELPMTQEQLADAVGLTSVHVNRTLKLLEAEGLIKRDRRNIQFADWERLQEVADFNSRYLHLAPQQTGA
jgi:CRP-like cAMP-binding protein